MAELKVDSFKIVILIILQGLKSNKWIWYFSLASLKAETLNFCLSLKHHF